jgi:hypothetical protein
MHCFEIYSGNSQLLILYIMYKYIYIYIYIYINIYVLHVNIHTYIPVLVQWRRCQPSNFKSCTHTQYLLCTVRVPHWDLGYHIHMTLLVTLYLSVAVLYAVINSNAGTSTWSQVPIQVQLGTDEETVWLFWFPCKITPH